MAIFGFREMLDGRVATLVVAADTVDEFTGWIEAVKGQDSGNFNELYSSTLLDYYQVDTFKGFRHSVIAAYHDDEDQREAFWAEWSIVAVNSAQARDRHDDMLHDKKEEIRIATETEEDRTRTIEERTGLDKADPWDRRTDAEREEDRKIKEQMRELAKKGELSGDSFGGADEQRGSRDRPNANNVPGAYGRTQAAEALKDIVGGDWEGKTNEELAKGLEDAGVPNVTGVYDDDKVPQKAQSGGSLHVEDIRGTRNEDGSFDISDILAHKHGGEVDEVQKAANEAEHQEQVAQAKAGRRAFDPEDFAAVLRGDGSADAVTHVEGDNRQRREGTSRPSLSDHAEAARQEHQEQERAEQKRRRTQAEKEQDVKARGERDRGIFKGADLVHDDDPTGWDDLPENVRETLEKAGLKRDEILVKNYPFNSELGGRALLPFDGLRTNDGVRLLGGVNLDIEGTMTMGAPGVAVASRPDTTTDGYGIYARKRVATSKVETDLDMGDIAQEIKVDVWLVRVRAG